MMTFTICYVSSKSFTAATLFVLPLFRSNKYFVTTFVHNKWFLPGCISAQSICHFSPYFNLRALKVVQIPAEGRAILHMSTAVDPN